ncbi:GH25 family lysozyme [Lentilactobacillus senioris]|uniref:GH25 family lysozyme n=1 Tax=Lentilactobacillus senioris TaxID=931534 RepID=UPI002280FBB6|nr:GH25 family lysozyme [Lentilactobacillus senioris]MCY9807011.1 GH25 family lysozyme [Lentilactobacillus senioris]
MGYPLVIDVASYQPSSLSYFRIMKQKGVKAVIIKVTDGSAYGTAYVNPLAKAQRINAEVAGLKVHAYHFSEMRGITDSRNEADFFYTQAKALGFDVTNCAMMLDIENPAVNSYPATADCNAFTDYLKGKGCRLTGVYSMASWFTAGRINAKALHADLLWVANYGVSAPGVDNTDIWQYSDKFAGYHQDVNYDFVNALTKGVKPHKPEYFKINPRLVSATTRIGIYKDKNLKTKIRNYDVGTQFVIKDIYVKKSGVSRLKTDSGFWISGNRDHFKNMYYVDKKLKRVKLIHSAYLYHDIDRKKPLRKYYKGEEFDIENIVKSKTGLWILKTSSGFYLTANKNYVKKIK